MQMTVLLLPLADTGERLAEQPRDKRDHGIDALLPICRDC
jgi:hypothetical protein